MRLLLDTNVLLRYSMVTDPRHEEVYTAIRRAGVRGWKISMAVQSLVECWVVATRPKDVNGYGLSAEEANQHLTKLRRVFDLLPDPPDLLDRWLGLCLRYDVKGRPAHDARLVAAMAAHGISRILTLNPGDFARYGEVIRVAPAEA